MVSDQGHGRGFHDQAIAGLVVQKVQRSNHGRIAFEIGLDRFNS